MAWPPHLKLRGNTYYIRIPVPEDVQSKFGGKPEITRSLKTKDFRVACERVKQATAYWIQEFQRAREIINSEPIASLGVNDIQRIADIFYYQRLAWDEAARGRGVTEEWLDGWEKALAEDLPLFKRGLARGNPSSIEPDINYICEIYGLKLDKSSEEYRRLTLALLKATVRSFEDIQARNSGQIIDTPEPPDNPSFLGGAEGKDDSLLLSKAFERWKDKHQGPQKTKDDWGAQIGRFISLHSDLRIDKITKAHVRDFRDAMLKYPSRPLPADRKLSVAEVIKKYAGSNVKKLGPKTVNENALAALKAILGHCVKDGFIEHNPAEGIRADEPRVTEKSRVPLTDSDIQLVLSFPIFTNNERPKGGGGEAAIWLPYIAMYSGARLEEIARLAKEDIGEEKGIKYFNIRDDVKNQSSYRKTPIHSQLIALGFLKFIKTIKSGQLFPELQEYRGKYSHAWSKWWGRYRRSHGLDDTRKVFHSFRHTVKRKLRNAEVEKTLRDAIMGHEAEDEAERYGVDEEGTNVEITVLKDAVEKISYS